MLVVDTITLRHLWNIKAVDYFHRSRDNRYGVPAKTFAQCYKDVQEDFGPPELDAYNKTLIAYWNRFMSNAMQVVWCDQTRDFSRLCGICGELCKYPTHAENYGTAWKGKKFYDEESNESITQ